MFQHLIKFLKEKAIEYSINHPKSILISGIIISVVFLGAFPKIVTDTDPVHMLPVNNPVVKLHNDVKRQFQVADIVALGIQTRDGSSLFSPDGLKKIKLITDEILKLEDKDQSDTEFFIKKDLLSVSTVDDIIKNDRGELLVTPLMNTLPSTQVESQKILEKLNANPLVGGKLSSTDGHLVGIFMPLKEGKKDRSYVLSLEIEKIAKRYLGENETYYFAGLPVAETTFGNEMFIQMAVFAPMAGVVIFILLLIFFRSAIVVLAPMILSMMAVIWSMGALIYSGNVIHIMSSMIPIFIMPIAVLDSVHILSILSAKIGEGLPKKMAIKETIMELFTPMFYTSLTTVIGFISLVTTGIPPVVVFGVTIAFGVAISFMLTIIFIPAYTMLLSDETLKKFGAPVNQNSPISNITNIFHKISLKFSKPIILVSIAVILISLIGVNKIIINDNPVRWFKENHPLRLADVEMNKALAGTYMSNLVFSFPETIKKNDKNLIDEFSEDEFVNPISIKNPSVVHYIDMLGTFLKTLKDKEGNYLIGGTTSIADLVKKVGDIAFNKNEIPKTREEISQYMFLFESGDTEKGRDMWKLILPGDGDKGQMWVHFKSGDNQNMINVENRLSEYMLNNPPPFIESEDGEKVQLQVSWSGLMYINKIWQAEMVAGMGEALLGSFVIVFGMMIFLFRSISWSLVAMLPLSITIIFIYGSIGFFGKFYDMPIAVLSSLTLGLSIDFAIHFIEHARLYNRKFSDYKQTLKHLFAGTSQAIWRNVMVISIGFTPLFFAALQPYFTVGMFFFLIMLVSGMTTLILLPSLITVLHKFLPDFRTKKE